MGGLFDKLKLTGDSRGILFLPGANGGVGSMVLQLAEVLLPEVHVIATSSLRETDEWGSVAGRGGDRSTLGRTQVELAEVAPDGVDWIFTSRLEVRECIGSYHLPFYPADASYRVKATPARRSPTIASRNWSGRALRRHRARLRASPRRTIGFAQRMWLPTRRPSAPGAALGDRGRDGCAGFGRFLSTDTAHEIRGWTPVDPDERLLGEQALGLARQPVTLVCTSARAAEHRGLHDPFILTCARGAPSSLATQQSSGRGICLSQAGARQGRAIAGGGGDRLGSVGRGRPGFGLTIRLR